MDERMYSIHIILLCIMCVRSLLMMKRMQDFEEVLDSTGLPESHLQCHGCLQTTPRSFPHSSISQAHDLVYCYCYHYCHYYYHHHYSRCRSHSNPCKLCPWFHSELVEVLQPFSKKNSSQHRHNCRRWNRFDQETVVLSIYTPLIRGIQQFPRSCF